MSVQSALSFFVAVFIFGITPGPGVFAILARALVQGAASCSLLALGMVVSDILYLVMACLGLAAVAANWGELFTLIRWAGGAYLLYLGWQLWRAPVQHKGDPRPVSRSSSLASFTQGFLISASNPKVILFYIAFLPGFMDLTQLTRGDIVLVSGLTLVALMASLMLIALFASRARQMLRSERALVSLNRTAGSIMAGAGIYLVTRH